MKGHHHSADIPDKYRFDGQIIRRVLVFLKPYKFYVIASLAMLLIFSVLQLAGPYIIKIAIDGPITNGDKAGLIKLSLLYLGTIIAGFIFMFGQIYLMSWIGQNIMLDLRLKLFKHIQKLDIKYFDKHPTGYIMTRLTSDIEMLNEMLSSGVVQIIGDILTVSGILVIMFVLSARLALISLVGLIFLIWITVLFRSRFRQSFRLVRSKVAVLNAFLQETIGGIHVIQLFNNQFRNFKEFDLVNTQTREAHLQTVFYFALFVPFVELANALSITLILIYGGILVPQNAITVGVLIAFFQYAQRFFRPIRDLSQKYNILQAALASSEKIFKVMDSDSIISVSDEPVKPGPCLGDVSFENVTFAYNDSDYVLKKVSFAIKQGETIAVVGATGAGKSTLTNLMTRFYDPQEGVIRLDGNDVRDLEKTMLRENISLVHQEAFIFSGTIAENIRLDRSELSDRQIQDIFEKMNLESFLDKFQDGLDHETGERGNRLSAGERQIISFARAMSYDPAVLILDEATSNIDTETEIMIQRAIERMTRKRTSIIIAHRLSTIRHADRIMVFHKGELREVGPHNELLEQGGIYSKLYEVYYSQSLSHK